MYGGWRKPRRSHCRMNRRYSTLLSLDIYTFMCSHLHHTETKMKVVEMTEIAMCLHEDFSLFLQYYFICVWNTLNTLFSRWIKCWKIQKKKKSIPMPVTPAFPVQIWLWLFSLIMFRADGVCMSHSSSPYHQHHPHPHPPLGCCGSVLSLKRWGPGSSIGNCGSHPSSAYHSLEKHTTHTGLVKRKRFQLKLSV